MITDEVKHQTTKYHLSNTNEQTRLLFWKNLIGEKKTETHSEKNPFHPSSLSYPSNCYLSLVAPPTMKVQTVCLDLFLSLNAKKHIFKVQK